MSDTIKQLLKKANIIEKSEMIETIGEMLEDADYALTQARSPKGKRKARATFDFFASIYTHIKQ